MHRARDSMPSAESSISSELKLNHANFKALPYSHFISSSCGSWLSARKRGQEYRAKEGRERI